MKNFAKVLMILVAAMFLLPGWANAYTFVSNTFHSDGQVNFDYVNANAPNGENYSGAAGAFTVTMLDENDQQILNEDGSVTEFLGFCVEPGQWYSKNNEADVELLSLSAVDGALEAAWLMDQHKGEDMLALQIAIWEVMLDSDSNAYDLYAGNFILNSSDGTSAGVAAGYLADIPTTFTPEMAATLSQNYSIARNDQYQDFIINKGAVPEPATMLLLGSGLIGLAGMGRKFRKKS